MRRLLAVTAAVCAAMAGQTSTNAATVTVDPSANWLGYVNVSELPSNGGAFLWGSSWGTADLVATFSGNVLSLSPNTIGDPDPYWYVGGGAPGAPGNKIVEANMYVEDDSLVGQTVTFEGEVLANTLTSAHTAVAFIKDFAPDYSSSNVTAVPLTPGPFSISLATDPTPGRHVQYGFTTTGVNVWATDVAPYGSVQVTAIPEPATALLGAVAMAAFAVARRNRLA